jgi:hypothetical protein
VTLSNKVLKLKLKYAGNEEQMEDKNEDEHNFA